MYSRQETTQLRKQFWTQFGQYMRPIPGADGGRVNWLNYQTGIKHLYFRMDADNQKATIAIELRHTDTQKQQFYYEQFVALKKVLEDITTEKWKWELLTVDEDNKQVTRIGTTLPGVNIFTQADWPAIISFLKPRILALDTFWASVKDNFE
jgi:hypothetical protein